MNQSATNRLIAVYSEVAGLCAILSYQYDPLHRLKTEEVMSTANEK
jgi:hypothetical protein